MNYFQARRYVTRCKTIAWTFSATCVFAAFLVTQGHAVTITSIGGVTNWDAGIRDGKVEMDCGKAYNGLRVIDDSGTYNWTIYGSGFGSSGGTVRLGGKSPRIIYWSASKIIIQPSLGWSEAPGYRTLEIKNTAGQRSTMSVNVAPSISSRITGQCTWWVAKQRLAIGKQPSKGAYAGYSPITANYAPKPGDQLQWKSSSGMKHTAIIESVSAPTMVWGKRRYAVTITEYNSKCTTAFNRYQTVFESYPLTGVVTQYMRSSITSMGNAYLYYR